MDVSLSLSDSNYYVCRSNWRVISFQDWIPQFRDLKSSLPSSQQRDPNVTDEDPKVKCPIKKFEYGSAINYVNNQTIVSIYSESTASLLWTFSVKLINIFQIRINLDLNYG